MTPEFKKQWIEALRSGRYNQYKGGWADDWVNPTKFCCLTVALKEAGQLDLGFQGATPAERAERMARNILEISNENIGVLMRMNDSENKSFEEIADWIEGQETL